MYTYLYNYNLEWLFLRLHNFTSTHKVKYLQFRKANCKNLDKQKL